jgi:hypothetical protein
MVTLVYRESIFVQSLLAITIQAIAALCMLWARITFGVRSFHASAEPTAEGLVSTGPYQFFAHPIYATILNFSWAGISSHPLPFHFLLGLAITAGLFIRMFAEERLVAGQQYSYLEPFWDPTGYIYHILEQWPNYAETRLSGRIGRANPVFNLYPEELLRQILCKSLLLILEIPQADWNKKR